MTAPDIEGDGDEEGTEEVTEAEVIPLPGAAAAAPAKPRRGEPGEWKPVIPEHLRTPEGRKKAAKWHPWGIRLSRGSAELTR